MVVSSYNYEFAKVVSGIIKTENFKLDVKQWDKKVLSAFVGQYVENSAYYNAIGISSSDLKQFIVDMLLNKQQTDINEQKSRPRKRSGFLLFGWLLQSLQLDGEVAHQFGLPGDADTAGNLLSSVEYVLQSHSDNIHMVVCIDSTGNAKT